MSYLALLMSLEGISYLLNDGESSPFSIDRLTALFRQCREMEEGIHLSTYLLAYEELNNVKTMLDYEKGVGMLEDANNCVNNGSRTLLRLHRALLFVVRFIESVRQSTSDNIITLAKAAYDCTLANYHSWIIRRAVHLALYTLPTRRELLRHILGNDDANNAEQCLDALMLECNTVYDAVEKLYGERKLLQLP
ncbi:Ceramide-1-phosphate transfer protein [Trichinella pseudospiralis]